MKIKKYFKENKFIIASITCLLILSFCFVKKAFQNDTFYTIKIGELILKNGIDMLDHFSIHNLVYTYPHWLYDVIIYLIYSLGGFKGLYISTIVFYSILISSIYYVNFKTNNNILISFFVAFISLIGLASYATARAQLISYILFVYEIYFIEMFLKSKNKKYVIGLIIISLLLCNMHVAVWPFFFILFLPYIAEYFCSLIFHKIKLKKENVFTNFIKTRFIIEKNKNYKYLFIIIGLCVLTGLLTPIGDTPYTYLFKTMMGNSQSYIVEHKAVHLLSNPFIYILIIEMLLFIILSKIKLRNVFLVIGLVFMSLSSSRHMALLMIFGLYTFGGVLCYVIEKYKITFDKSVIKVLSHNAAIFIMLAVTIIIGYFTYTKCSKADFIDQNSYPIKLVDYMKKNMDTKNMRLYNEYNFGSYILFNDVKVFIDSRADLYTKPFSGLDYDIFDDYMSLLNSGYYQIPFDFYNITHALIFKNQNLYYNLSKSNDYILVKEDNNFALFEKVEKNG